MFRDEELKKERHARLDAERQVIKMYGELETAWSKIAKLEVKVKQLKRKNNNFPWAVASSPSMAYQDAGHVGGILVDPPTLESFQQCLGQLQTMLGELKVAHSAAIKQPVSNNGNEVEAILGTLHSAVRDLVSKVDHHRTTEIHQYLQPASTDTFKVRPTQLLSDSLPSIRRNNNADFGTGNRESNASPKELSRGPVLTNGPSQRASEVTNEDSSTKSSLKVKAQHLVENGTTKPSSAPRTLTSTPLSEAPVPKLDQLIRRSKTIASPDVTDTSAKGSATTVRGSANAPRPSAVVEKPMNEKQLATSEPVQTSDGREKSLKSLKNNLEQIEKELLHQFRPNGDQPTLHQIGNLGSLLSAHSSVAESSESHSTQRNYSMDFDSTSTSIASTAYRPKSQQKTSKSEGPEPPARSNGNAKVPVEKTKENGLKLDSKPGSRSSSTVNLSSIVDLLGDFSVGDLGSSTITPP